MPARDRDTDLRYLRHAARLACRGHGGAEPNPMVGCVVVGREGEVVGEGYHRSCGGPHAEIVALREAGPRAHGATVFVTLEPCNHRGRTGPCSEALVAAGVGRVVYARADPGRESAGGGRRLAEAGVTVDVIDDCPEALLVSAPFVHRLRTGLPWIIAKWAQTVDGRIATRQGRSRWISNDRSRRLVHRERGRVDAILTGIGTVRADDPLLTARGVRRRRVARRIVVDPRLEMPPGAQVVTTAPATPTTIVTSVAARPSARAAELEKAGVEVVAAAADGDALDLAAALRELTTRHDLANMLVEAGPGLLGSLFRQGLVNEAWVFVAPMLLGDEQALPCVRGLTANDLTDGCALTLCGVHRRGGDVLLRYFVP